MATGKRAHKPFVITKELDKSSPLLYNNAREKGKYQQMGIAVLDP